MPKNKNQTLFGPETFKKVYTKWANDNEVFVKGIRGNLLVPDFRVLGGRRKEKFETFLFVNGLYVKRINKEWYLAAVDADNPAVTMFMLQAQ